MILNNFRQSYHYMIKDKVVLMPNIDRMIAKQRNKRLARCHLLFGLCVFMYIMLNRFINYDPGCYDVLMTVVNIGFYSSNNQSSHSDHRYCLSNDDYHINEIVIIEQENEQLIMQNENIGISDNRSLFDDTMMFFSENNDLNQIEMITTELKKAYMQAILAYDYTIICVIDDHDKVKLYIADKNYLSQLLGANKNDLACKTYKSDRSCFLKLAEGYIKYPNR